MTTEATSSIGPMRSRGGSEPLRGILTVQRRDWRPDLVGRLPFIARDNAGTDVPAKQVADCYCEAIRFHHRSFLAGAVRHFTPNGAPCIF
jgi:hypothetical protein